MPLPAAPSIPLLPKSFLSLANRSLRVLIVDDDPDFAESLRYRLEQRPFYNVEVAHDPFEAANRLADQPFDMVIADFLLQDWSGLTTLENADHLIDVDPTVNYKWKDSRPVKVVFCSSMPVRMIDLKRSNRLKHFAVVGFLPKVCGLENLCLSIEKLIHGNDRPAA